MTSSPLSTKLGAHDEPPAASYRSPNAAQVASCTLHEKLGSRSDQMGSQG